VSWQLAGSELAVSWKWVLLVLQASESTFDYFPIAKGYACGAAAGVTSFIYVV